MTKEELQAIAGLLDEKLKPINDRLDKMDNRFDNVDNRLVSLEQGQTKIEVTIENQVDRAIKTIAEGHGILNRKLDEKISLENRVETLEHKVSALEYAIKKAE